MERELSLWQRIDLRMHLILCRFCRRFQASVLVLRQHFVRGENYGDSGKVGLSVEAKTRIRNAIRQQTE